jgi:hypothetical protein
MRDWANGDYYEYLFHDREMKRSFNRGCLIDFLLNAFCWGTIILLILHGCGKI